MTLEEAIGRVRLKLGFPPFERLSDGVVHTALNDVTDELNTEFNLTRQGWNTRKTKVTVDSSKDTYLLPVMDFGTASLVITQDPSNSNHNARVIPIVSEAGLFQQYGGGDPGASGVKHSASACTFYERDGSQWVQFAPRPRVSAEYLIIYRPSHSRPETLDAPVFPESEFDNYLTDLAAFRLLGIVSWSESVEADEARRAAIRVSLVGLIERGDSRFIRRKRSKSHQQPFTIVPFGRSRRGGRRRGRGGQPPN